MLIACSGCRRQYDVGRRPPGSRIRCYCGALNTVPDADVHTAPMERCASCGGRLREGSRTCDYCGSEVTLGERGWGDACPSCFARLVKGAAFCSACGTRIEPHGIRSTEGSESCPRCQIPMSLCDVPGASFVECTSCGGVWLDEALFEEAVQDRERESAIASFFAEPGEQGARSEDIRGPTMAEVRYLKCPVCAKIMNRRNFARASGIIVDRCADHGYWLDAHEMEAILAFVASGGLEKARRAEVERQKAELERARFRAATARAGGGARPLGVGDVGGTGSIPVPGGVVRALTAFLDVLVD